MSDLEKVNALRHRLSRERQRMVEAMAEVDVLPPASAIAYLADLDATLVAIEAVIDGWDHPVGSRNGPSHDAAGLQN
jgi:hypothetical protein